MSINTFHCLWILGDQVNEFEVEGLAVLASATVITIIIEDSEQDSRSFVDKIAGNEKLSVGLLKIWVELEVSWHNMQRSGWVLESHAPSCKLLPYLLVLSKGQVPEGPVVHFSGLSHCVLLL